MWCGIVRGKPSWPIIFKNVMFEEKNQNPFRYFKTSPEMIRLTDEMAVKSLYVDLLSKPFMMKQLAATIEEAAFRYSFY
jgi:hypothetical protein